MFHVKHVVASSISFASGRAEGSLIPRLLLLKTNPLRWALF